MILAAKKIPESVFSYFEDEKQDTVDKEN